MKSIWLKCIILIFALLSICSTYAQDWKRANIWHFGYNAGLDFNTVPPTPLTNGKVNTIEGCASICDTNGNLLLYTDGATVWNKNHQVIINGSGLKGEPSTTQNSVFIPVMDGDSMFLLFTLDAGGAGVGEGLNYNLINTNATTGQGEILLKNQTLITGLTEKMAVTRHDNGRDYWLLVHGAHNNIFYTYLISYNGTVGCPIKNSIGTTYNGSFNKGGIMKFNPESSRLVVSLWYKDLEIIYFDNSKGLLYNNIKVTGLNFVYGVEFSQSSKYIYVLERNGRLMQIEAENPDSIEHIYSNTSVVGIQGLQVTPHGKILLATNSRQYLSVISFPEKKGDSCQLDTFSINLQGKTSSYGLPNFVSNYFRKPDKTIKYNLCLSNSFTGEFTGAANILINSWKWTFKDAGLNTVGTSNGQQTTFTFPDTGVYKVQLIADSDTLFKQIHIGPKLDLGKDTILCNLKEFTLTVPDNFRCIQWQDGSDTALYKVTQSGAYHVRAYDTKGCLLSDTVNIKIGNIWQPSIVRSGDSLYTDTGSYTYQWYLNNNSIGITTPFYRAKQTGSYQVKITDSIGCTSLSQEFTVAVLSVKEAAKLGILVYPNPLTKGQELNIESEKPINSIQVFNSLAQQVQSESGLETNTYKLKNLNRGIYTLIINQTVYVKIIIH